MVSFVLFCLLIRTGLQAQQLGLATWHLSPAVALWFNGQLEW